MGAGHIHRVKRLGADDGWLVSSGAEGPVAPRSCSARRACAAAALAPRRLPWTSAHSVLVGCRGPRSSQAAMDVLLRMFRRRSSRRTWADARWIGVQRQRAGQL